MQSNYSDREIKRILNNDIEMPYCVNASVSEALNKINTGYEKKGDNMIRFRKINSFKRKIAVAAAVCVLCIGATAGAAALLKWNAKVADKFQVDEPMQEELVENGVATILDASDTSNGVTISAEQSLADDKFMYILFKVTAPEDMLLTEDTFFQSFSLLADGKDPNISYFSGLIQGENGIMEDGTDNVTYWEVWILQNELGYLNGKTLEASFTDLGFDDSINKTGVKTAIEGNWKMSWVINEADVVENTDVNARLESCNAAVTNVSISPISIRVRYDYERNAIEGIAYSDDGTTSTTTYYEDPIMPTYFVLADGSRTEIQAMGPGSTGYIDEETTSYEINLGLTKIADVKNIVAVVFIDGDNEIEVPVK